MPTYRLPAVILIGLYLSVTIACGQQAYYGDPQSDWGKFLLCVFSTAALALILRSPKSEQ